MPLIDVHKVRKVYANGQGKNTVALDDFSLQVEEKEFITIVGPSGCGKTTFLLLVAGLEQITSGVLLFDGHPIDGPDANQTIIFQEYVLFPWRTVAGNIEFGPEVKGISKRKRREIIKNYVRLVGLEGFENRYPHELSGGMRQRVAIARALANEPKLLLMDEPFGSLDALTREAMQVELLRIWQENRCTVLFVTHSIEEAVFLSDRLVVVSSQPGRVKKIFHIPFGRPRKREIITSTDFVALAAEVKGLILEEENYKERINRWEK
ncbi:MAG: ABC transporter ATP-binding protein [Nitrospirota bacterium]